LILEILIAGVAAVQAGMAVGDAWVKVWIA